MSENKDNRWFYKFTEKEIQEYRVKEKDHIKIITRLNPDFPQNIELFRELFPDCKMLKYKPEKDKEKTILYNWDLTPYNNLGFGDTYNYISNIIINKENLNEFTDIIKNNFNDIYFRKNNKFTYTLKISCEKIERGIWISEIPRSNFTKYPIAILSFGRYNEYGRTHKLLTKLKIQHYLFVEPCEYKIYKKWYDKSYCVLLEGERNYHLDNMGSTPMRNYILRYFKWYRKERVWMLDDNIKCYKRLYKTGKNIIEDIEIFTSIENYVMRYDNVGIASHNFNPEVREGGCRNIMCKNGKCYSSMLIPLNNDIKFNHKHQEDNFISIEYICKGYTNLCFNHILYDKNTSGADGGGNTTFIYKKEEGDIGRKERYDYSFETAERLINSGEIKLKKDKTLNNFIFHKPSKHEYWHCEFQYNLLENFNKNDIKRNDTEIQEYKYNLYLNTKEQQEEEEEIEEEKEQEEEYQELQEEEDERNKLMKLSKNELIDIILGKKITNVETPYKIVIPSYNRVDTLKYKTLKMLERQGIDKSLIYIFVANDIEYNKYKKEFTDYNIIKGIKGLLPQIEFIENYFNEGDYLVRIEDDIESIFKKKHSKKDYPEKITRKQLSETEEINLHDFIINGFKLLKEHKLNFFGINKTQNAFMMGDGYSTDLRLIEGCFNGFINKRYKLVVCNHNNYTLEDLERTIVFYKNDGGILRFNDIGYITTYNAEGGVTSDVENRNLKINENTKKMNEVYSKYGTLKPNKRQNGEWFELKRRPKNN